MLLFLALNVAWFILIVAFRATQRHWRRQRDLQPARSLGEVRGTAYYRALAPSQVESLILQVLRTLGYTILGDPFLGRSYDQGFAWKSGQRLVLEYVPHRRLAASDLRRYAALRRSLGADLLVLSPFDEVPPVQVDGVKVVAGENLSAWFSVLRDVRPPSWHGKGLTRCDCGGSMVEGVNRGGQLLLVCTRRPDCNRVLKLETAEVGWRA